MNILFIADIVPYPPNTGIKIRTFNIIRQLSQDNGNSIFLLAFNHKILINEKQELDRCVEALQLYCKEVHVFDIPSDRNRVAYFWCLAKNILQISPYRVKRYYSKGCINTIRKIVGTHHVDLVHLDKTELYCYARFFKGLPTFCTNHNVESQLMKRRVRYETSLPRKIFAYLQYLKTSRYEKNVLNKVNGYITCTDVDAHFFRTKLNVRSPQATIDNGVDTSYYSKTSLAEDDFVLIIGAQNKESTANFDATHYFMAEIWPLIAKRDPSLRLKIVGRNPDKTITDLSQRLDNVEVLGFVEDEREILARTKALLVPLRVGGGSRLKILTAFAMGKAVVSTRIGAEGIVCESGENILIADDPESFASSTLEVVHNQDLRQQLCLKARSLAEARYDWNKLGLKLIAFYQEIVNLASESHN
jgi:polysaccharide biosynthesis protein PslH